MARVVEKADGTVVLLVHLSLKPGRDDAIIQLLRSVPKGGLAGMVREAMRTGVSTTPVQKPEEGEVPFELPDLGIDL